MSNADIIALTVGLMMVVGASGSAIIGCLTWLIGLKTTPLWNEIRNNKESIKDIEEKSSESLKHLESRMENNFQILFDKLDKINERGK